MSGRHSKTFNLDQPPFQGARHGVTLLEFMLVLALLVMVGAMAYPSFRVPFQMQTLRKAGEQVRVEWCRARIKAMKTGQIQMFTFEPETGSFTLQHYYTEQDILEVDASLGGMGTGMTGGAQAINSAQQSGGSSLPAPELPEGVVFATVEVQSDMRSLQLQQETQGSVPGMSPQTLAQQSPPVLFYPDGTTSDAKIALTNEYQRLYVVVSIRSLTGIVKVSELVSADELQQVP